VEREGAGGSSVNCERERGDVGLQERRESDGWRKTSDDGERGKRKKMP
jgi:hypothetical protein